ncbi:uncharacterized protein LOC103956171 isoform X2 [Pyrus x bretschneideri]|uniref:uncharacterized protein LOC103956171 isoform X2 n=1 Tax=Pyrus x bretschneideri TaxID=225117 RepID=UPI002030C2D6|nr:uncharacterized protein LOC103956171 isoform X2 [Pyrus x bretschneideri]XP_048433364.1 uncharacterized protein LOC103956171 isoform X2 [Pyrus x bretschneideri]XP_048433365.1 uncharacterized protein LOC103956171 isoform X2 [Pyrus x bretschneideri]
MEKAVTYKANFEEEHSSMCFGWEFVPQGKLSYILEAEHHAENIRRIGTMGEENGSKFRAAFFFPQNKKKTLPQHHILAPQDQLGKEQNRAEHKHYQFIC